MQSKYCLFIYLLSLYLCACVCVCVVVVVLEPILVMLICFFHLKRGMHVYVCMCVCACVCVCMSRNSVHDKLVLVPSHKVLVRVKYPDHLGLEQSVKVLNVLVCRVFLLLDRYGRSHDHDYLVAEDPRDKDKKRDAYLPRDLGKEGYVQLLQDVRLPKVVARDEVGPCLDGKPHKPLSWVEVDRLCVLHWMYEHLGNATRQEGYVHVFVDELVDKVFVRGRCDPCPPERLAPQWKVCQSVGNAYQRVFSTKEVSFVRVS